VHLQIRTQGHTLEMGLQSDPRRSHVRLASRTPHYAGFFAGHFVSVNPDAGSQLTAPRTKRFGERSVETEP
jgi:hypothetical protein